MNEIYLSGCYGWCEGCHSPHTHDFSLGKDLSDNNFLDKLLEDIRKREINLDNIVILGGEPLDQPKEDLECFLDLIAKEFPDKKIWLYTHFTEKDVSEQFSYILDKVHYLKVGKYDKNNPNNSKTKDALTNVILATINQYFIKGNL